ncbi:helix-turn-helix domain-containing protein [Lacrimispora sp.]|uniref:helix-turn-helix domain-containing protein n=1 Tax=Lacrimispora sp. TaxID=2719234 RepID=UPI0028AB646F|nr:helix-turn-helix transcriptional regulator [Lacrimispora sp.]
MYYDIEKAGRRIHELRTKMGISQERLACEIHIHKKTISKAERGVSSLSIDHLVDIADYFDVTLDYLVLGRKQEIGGEINAIFENLECSGEKRDQILQLIRGMVSLVEGA